MSLAFQFSSWYPKFKQLSIRSTTIPLDDDFINYLHADGIFIPHGSRDDDNEDEDDESDDEDDPHFTFPNLDAQIRACIAQYTAVFPKLNYSSPKDAAWVLPSSHPLRCTSPADVYMLLKSSDFINHDLEQTKAEGVPLQLVLRKWYPVDKAREVRCFVYNQRLIGISQRDTNYYDYLNDPKTRDVIQSTVLSFWTDHIQSQWPNHPNYTFDLLLTRDLQNAHILDFGPFAEHTDPLLFTYPQLESLTELTLLVIDSPSHPAANCQAPANRHNMMPFEAISLSDGRDIEEFAELWKEQTKQAAAED